MKNSNLRWNVAQKAELKWWNLYLGKKPKQSYLQWKKEYWHSVLWAIRDAVTVDSTDTVLDIGCGPAGMFIALESNQVTAVDPLIKAYEEQLDHFDSSEYPGIQFKQDSIESFRSEQTFDHVFCLNAINHVRDISLGFDKLSKFVRPKGKLILSIDTHNFIFFKKLFRLLPVDILHPHQYDLKEYNGMLESSGFQILKSKLLKNRFFFDYHIIVAEKANP